MEFNIKSKHFSNALRVSSLYVISCTRQPLALLTEAEQGYKLSPSLGKQNAKTGLHFAYM